MEEDLVGKTIGSYQIIEEIGSGGMATVYKAYQPSLNRYVAIKVLPPQLTFDKSFIQRFLREASTAAGLNHPNIVSIYDVGQADGIYYFVMEYLEGETLKEILEREGALPPKRILRIIRQLANALDYAHKRGVVHRDIKPSNIFIGEGDHVTLTDFGIAKAMCGTKLTRTGMIMGTPEYISPEQGEGKPSDWRSDVYSLGVVLYEMLTGRIPFEGETPLAVIHKQVYEAPPPLRQINPSIPKSIERVVMHSLAKRPEERYGSAGELAMALAEGMIGKVRAPSRPSPEAPTTMIPGRAAVRPVRMGFPRALALGMGIGAAILLVFLGVMMLGRREGPPIAIAPTPTATMIPLLTATQALTSTPTPTPTPVFTATPLPPTPTNTPIPHTPTSTPTPIPVFMATPLPPTPTNTPIPHTPTFTPEPPTPTLEYASPTPTPAATDTPIPEPPPPGEVGRILYTIRIGQLYYLASADPSWTSPTEVGLTDWEHSTCWPLGNTASTLMGKSYAIYRPPHCRINPSGYTVCRSPDKNYEVVIGQAAEGIYSINLRQAGDQTSGEFIYQGRLDWKEGIIWAPDSSRFLFVVGDTVNAVTPGEAGYFVIIPMAYTPQYSPDGSLIMYLRPVAPGINDIFIVNADGSNPRNITNVPQTDKLCPVWRR